MPHSFCPRLGQALFSIRQVEVFLISLGLSDFLPDLLLAGLLQLGAI